MGKRGKTPNPLAPDVRSIRGRVAFKKRGSHLRPLRVARHRHEKIGLPDLSDDRRQVLVTHVHAARCRRVDVGDVARVSDRVIGSLRACERALSLRPRRTSRDLTSVDVRCPQDQWVRAS